MRRTVIVSVLALGLILSPVPWVPAPAMAAKPETVSRMVEGLRSQANERSPASQGAQRRGPGGEEFFSEPTTMPIDFSMVGFKLPNHAELMFRTSSDGKAWSIWQEADLLEDEEDGPDPGAPEDRRARQDWRLFTEPIWVGEARYIQIRVKGAAPESVQVHVIDSMGLSRSFGSRIVDGLRSLWNQGHPTAYASSGLPIITRAEWGADESLRRSDPSYAPEVLAAVVHHTAGSNNYTRQQAPAIVRAIYHYHTVTLGWNDIGYNFLVDRFGQIYEGRYGGMDQAVIGAHAGGFNTGTSGISILGTFTDVAPSETSVNAVSAVVAWKSHLHGIDPLGQVTLTSRGSTRYSSGTEVTLPTIFAHRDVSATTCPGERFYQRLPAMRQDIAWRVLGAGSRGIPITGDWNGNGQATPGWFVDGVWLLRNRRDMGPAEIVFQYGRKGDVPVVGDWNGNGQDTVGVYRGDTFYLLNRNESKAADHSVRFGKPGWTPVAGDWNGNGRDTPGVVSQYRWFLRNDLRGGPHQIRVDFGRPGWTPVPGDWNGDGRDTPAIVSQYRWFFRNDLRGGPHQWRVDFGRPDWDPVAGDWTGNGRDGIGSVALSTWFLRHSPTSGTYHERFIYTGP